MIPSEIRSAQFNDTYFPTVDGVVQTVHNYATIMNRNSYSCVVSPREIIPFDDTTLEYDVFRSKILNMRFTEYSIPRPKSDKVLRENLVSKKLDIFHFHSPFFMGSYAVKLASELHIPCIATFHSKYYDDVINITGSKFLAKRVTNHIVKLYNKADAVWSCSNGTADTLRSYGYKGDIFVIDNGSSLFIPENDRPSLKEKARQELSLPTDKKIILFVGHLIWHKNIKLVLDTFKELDDPGHYALVLAGEGYDGNDIRKYASKLQFREGSVKFLGKISDRKVLAGLYLNADLLFFPSVYDNSPLVVREAASLGLPALLTEGSNAAEAVRDGFSGYTAREDTSSMVSKIREIFSGPDEVRARVRAAAESTIPKTWPDIVRTAEEKYLEIIERYRATKK